MMPSPGRLADLHRAIAEHLQTGRDVDEVRFVLRRVFERFGIADADGGQAIVAHDQRGRAARCGAPDGQWLVVPRQAHLGPPTRISPQRGE
jgi:hypothetical protein